MRNTNLQALKERADTSGQRAKTEKLVLDALPDDESLDIRRVTCNQGHLRLRANADARVDLHVYSFEEVPGLMQRFEALPMSMVKMVRAGQTPTMSFYPTSRVPAEWDQKYETGPIAPALFQVGPGMGSMTLDVYVEWFTQLAGLVVNIRVYVTDHRCVLCKNNVGAWMISGTVPEGRVRYSKSPTNSGPEALTVFWPTDQEFLHAMEDIT